MSKYTLILILFLTILTGCAGIPPTPAVPPMETQGPSGIQPNIEPPIAVEPAFAAVPEKRAYLTFDDGPNSHYTGPILDILKKYGVKATFVVVGSNIEKNPDVFQRIQDEGHHVVNHTYSHDYKKIYASPEAFLTDLEAGNRTMTAFTGKESKIFRAPGGPSNLGKNYWELLDRNGYRSLGWNVASADTDPKGVSPEQIIHNVLDGVQRVEKMKKSPVILMHDGTEINLKLNNPPAAVRNYIRSRESDVAALPSVIEFLLERGYTLAGVDENSFSDW